MPRLRTSYALALLTVTTTLLAACSASDQTAVDASPSSPSAPTSPVSATPSPTASPTPHQSPTAPSEPSEEVSSAPAAPDPIDSVSAVEQYVDAQGASSADPAHYRPASEMGAFATSRAIEDMERYQEESLEMGLVTGGSVGILRTSVEEPGSVDHDGDGIPSAEIRACLDASETWLHIEGEEPVDAEGSIPYTAFFTVLHDGESWKVDEFWTPESSPC